ncbi:DUF2306 domain-containing protein [Loktanella sp. TSTF-M6]|uniref:DUF2306 domain-containing protein n=1 Tax=Loktanella gaetbuli TaxID=2881335 RepID=A0ABS8BRX5_9RHOB|nr:DUF2306 domain-containing protein [Loktanella gaetbuli]MCB5198484.1 DUF2306 domain-containing protein [Loktanella gaetbuli]
MTLSPILTASPVLQIHIACALVALAVGPFTMFTRLPRGQHKGLGYTWVAGIVGLSLSSFWIPSFGLAVVGHFGPLHMLAVAALHGVWSAIRHVRRGNIRAHRLIMRNVWFGTMGVATLANFLPGRTMNHVVLNGDDRAGWLVIGLGLVALVWLWRQVRGGVSATT